MGTFLKCFVWLDHGLNPQSPSLRADTQPQGQWAKVISWKIVDSAVRLISHVAPKSNSKLKPKHLGHSTTYHTCSIFPQFPFKWPLQNLLLSKSHLYTELEHWSDSEFHTTWTPSVCSDKWSSPSDTGHVPSKAHFRVALLSLYNVSNNNSEKKII